MKAAQINSYGDPSVMKINEIDTPTMQDNQVLVEVHASSINPFDGKLRSGAMKTFIPLTFPVTLGGDIAGIVTEVGPRVTTIAVGDKVYGQAAAVAGNSGAFAEFAATSVEEISQMPRNLDFKQAASLPLVGVSALQALTEHINLQKGQKIFVTGGAGGIGTIAIQIAKHIGAYVATTATGKGLEITRQLGADEVIDYKTQDFTEILHDFDAVYDLVGTEFEKTFQILKKEGKVVSMIAQPNEERANQLGITPIRLSTKVTTERLIKLAELVEAGVVQPQIDTVFRLDDIAEAFVSKENGTAAGKVVIEIKQ
jgi:alcohol dehydrogenase